jgi:Flp pilus assembly protein TadG
MKRRRALSTSSIFRQPKQHGVVITLVSVFMLGAVLAMAALSIDVVTLYTARSEAQLAADAAALAGARVFANSGVTSDATGRTTSRATTLATTVAKQVAMQNQVGGQNLTTAEVTVSSTDGTSSFDTNPQITVKIQKTDLPSFFARVWGKTANTVTASATAEAYNPSGANALDGTTVPVAPLCVKPWLLQNVDPTGQSSSAIFDRTTGAIETPSFGSFVNQPWPSTAPGGNQNGLYSLCSGDCSGGISTTLAAGAYYPGAIGTATNDFAAPSSGQVTGSTGFNAYQLAVAGCVTQPIACNQQVNIDVTPYSAITGSRDSDTAEAAELLIHYNGTNSSDSIDPFTRRPPLQFIGGTGNPVTNAQGNQILISDSLVTIPVIDYPFIGAPPTPAAPAVTVIGFLQVFLNSQSGSLPYPNPGTSLYEIPATIVNLTGCGINASGTPIQGNGASPVAVRLISS